VYALANQSDGGMIVGGDFTEIDGSAHSNLARFNADGTLDETWHASTNGPVFALALGGDGSLFVGGLFNDAGGQVRLCLAKFSAAGTVDAQWTASANFTVLTIATGADESVFVGGYFQQVNGEPRSYIAKLSQGGAGTLDATWMPAANARVLSLRTDSSGSLYAAGLFTTIGGVAQPYLARLSATGGGAVDSGWNPAANGVVNSIQLDGNGLLYTTGLFTSIGGQPIPYLARLPTAGNGNADAAWKPAPDELPNHVSIGGDGSIYVGGFFHSMGGLPRDHIAKVSPDGAGDVDAGWDASTDGRVWVTRENADTLFIGGSFSNVAGTARHSLAEVAASNGTAHASVDATAPGKAFALATQHDGGVIVGGRFFSAGGQPRDGLLRLMPNGSLDPSWHPAVAFGADVTGRQVGALAVDANDDVYVGGLFDAINGTPRQSLAKLSANGSVDVRWAPSANAYIGVLTLEGNALFVGGDFTEINGAPRAYLAKLATGTGALDANWNPAPDYDVYAIAADGAGSLYVGGDFFSIGGQSRNFAAKVSSSGSGAVDPDWIADADSTVLSLVPDHAGSVFAGGAFFFIGGDERRGLAKLDATTGDADPDWNPSTSPIGAFITAMALQGDSIYVGGSFYEVDRVPRASIAKLSTTGAGTADPAFDPGVGDGPNGSEGLLGLTVANSVLYANGGFTTIGGAARLGIAALPIAQVGIDINQEGLTGAWYDPRTVGQGFEFVISPSAAVPGSGNVFGAWYTYDTTGGGVDTQRWYSLQGSYPAAAQGVTTSTDLTIYRNLGGTFDSPPVTSAVPVGSGTLSFDSCTNGAFTYAFDDGRTGTVPLQNLLPNVACVATGEPTNPPSDFGLSGAWYEPATGGQGFIINVNPVDAQVFVGWYTYAADGDTSEAGQRWFSAQGSYAVGSSTMQLTVFESTGGTFNSPEDVVSTIPVGMATLSFSDCTTAAFGYEFTTGEFAGRVGDIELTRLGASPMSCDFAP
ncbi:MAG: hypothetical protein ACREPX_06395, partial [Rhodanobacteraceae bacterium]